MSRSSSLSGLGRGRARGRRDIAESEQLAERRPGRFRVEDWEGELAGTQSDAESKWITMEYNTPSPYLGYNSYFRRQSPFSAPFPAPFPATIVASVDRALGFGGFSLVTTRSTNNVTRHQN